MTKQIRSFFPTLLVTVLLFVLFWTETISIDLTGMGDRVLAFTKLPLSIFGFYSFLFFTFGGGGYISVFLWGEDRPHPFLYFLVFSLGLTGISIECFWLIAVI